MWTLYSPQFSLQLLVYGIFGNNPIFILISLSCGCANLLKSILCPADHRMLSSKLPYMAFVPTGITLWQQSEEVLILLIIFFLKPKNLKQDLQVKLLAVETQHSTFSVHLQQKFIKKTRKAYINNFEQQLSHPCSNSHTSLSSHPTPLALTTNSSYQLHAWLILSGHIFSSPFCHVTHTRKTQVILGREGEMNQNTRHLI